MDLKALIAKMDHIESKQILNEGFPTVADAKARADKEKTTGKFDKKELSTGTQYTRKSSTFDDGGKDKDQKKAEKKKKNESFSFKPGGIAHHLLSEFNLVEAPVVNPYQGADAAKFAAMSPEDQAHLTKGGQVPNINDEFILARAPNKGQPVAAPAQPAAAPAAAGEPEAQAAAPAAAQQGVEVTPVPAAQPSSAPAGASAEGNAGEAEAQAAMAAASKWPTTPAEIKAFQTANKLKPDGLIGAQTMAALQKAGATPPAGFKPVGNKAKPAVGQAAQPAATPAAGNPNANQTVSTAARTGVDLGAGNAGGGRGGQGGPTAAQAAQSGNPAVAKIDAEIKRFSAKNNMTIAANQNYVAKKEAEKAALLGGGQAAQPAAAPAKRMARGAAPAAPLTQSVRHEDDAILERIRTALFR